MFGAGGKMDERWPEESCEKAWALELADDPVRLQAGRVQPKDGQGDGDQGGHLEDGIVYIFIAYTKDDGLDEGWEWEWQCVKIENFESDGDQGGQLEEEFATPSEGGPNNNYSGNDNKIRTFTNRSAAPRMMIAMMW